jgi:hypothetical protein
LDARVRKDGHAIPELAAFMAKLRAAFGDKAVDDAIGRGKAGEVTFTPANTVELLARRARRARMGGASTHTSGTGIIAPAAMANA